MVTVLSFLSFFALCRTSEAHRQMSMPLVAKASDVAEPANATIAASDTAVLEVLADVRTYLPWSE